MSDSDDQLPLWRRDEDAWPTAMKAVVGDTHPRPATPACVPRKTPSLLSIEDEEIRVAVTELARSGDCLILMRRDGRLLSRSMRTLTGYLKSSRQRELLDAKETVEEALRRLAEKRRHAQACRRD